MISRSPIPTPYGPALADLHHESELPRPVVRFLERLRRLPLGAWAEAGRRLEELDARDRSFADLGAGQPPGRRTGGAVRANLRALADDMPRMTALARGRILDLATVLHGFVLPREAARMKKAALAAVLALLARPSLGEQQFAEAYEPFATVIPLDSLSADPVDAQERARWADAELEE